MLNWIRALVKQPRYNDLAALDTQVFNVTEFDVPVSNRHLQRFSNVVGWCLPYLPPTYLQVLATPLVKQILVHPEFPFSPLGIVHTRNEIVIVRQPSTGARLQISCQLQPFQETEKGSAFAIDITVNDGLGDCYLAACHMLKLRTRDGARKKSAPKAESQALVPTSSLEFDLALAKRYAKVSGDYNPIHLADFSAKLFGFRKAIIHGMCSQAMCLSVLATQGHCSFEQDASINVAFKKPILLPHSCELQVDKNAKLDFALSSGGRPHIVGSVWQGRGKLV